MTLLDTLRKSRQLREDLAQIYAESRALIEESSRLCAIRPSLVEAWRQRLADHTSQTPGQRLANVIMALVLARYDWTPLPHACGARTKPAAEPEDSAGAICDAS